MEEKDAMTKDQGKTIDLTQEIPKISDFSAFPTHIFDRSFRFMEISATNERK